MMKNAAVSHRLIDRLPAVRGRYNENVTMANVTWFRVGGAAEVIFRPADRDDLVDFLVNKPADVPLLVMGVGSNLLVRDGGVPGVVIRLGKGFARINAEEDCINAGAGALDVNVALIARMSGVAGLEFLSGVPGTIGGALRMNAGAYGSDINDILEQAEAVTPHGEVKHLTVADMKFGYRHCGLPEDWIFTSARLRRQPGKPEDIDAQINAIRAARHSSQPIRARTGGSTFANPPSSDKKAWQLIDEAGCRGLRRGGAMVSEQHCNFLINADNATAADLEALGEEVRRRVQETSGITLDWEIRRVGDYAGGPAEYTAQHPAGHDDGGEA
jgi:UDP-N-acetylmuramate dehydrogenase